MGKGYNVTLILNTPYPIHTNCIVILYLFSNLFFWTATFSTDEVTFKFPLNKCKVKLLLSFLVPETLAKSD